MDNPKHVGVREIASHCGLSFSTVAAALRGDTWVAAATRAKVLGVARELDYRSDPAASILGGRRRRRSERTYSIAYISAVFGQEGPRTHGQRLTALESATQSRGFHFEHIELRDARHARVVERRLLATGVDGIIVGPVEAKSFLDVFRVSEFCVISDDPGLVLHGFDSVRANHFLATQRLLMQATRRGYRRIAIVLRCHRGIHADDRARYGAIAAFRDLEQQPASIEILLWPFQRPNLSLAEQRAEEQAELTRLHEERPLDLLVGFDRTEHQLAKNLPGAPVDFAAMIVRVPDRGEIAGNQFDQEIVAEHLMARLVEKIRARSRGLSVSPVESVLDLAWFDGRSMSRPLPAEAMTAPDEPPLREEPGPMAPAEPPVTPAQP